MKVCSKCGLNLSVEKFRIIYLKKEGMECYAKKCKKCESEYRKEYRSKNPEKVKQWVKEYRLRNEEKIREKNKEYSLREENKKKRKETHKKK